MIPIAPTITLPWRFERASPPFEGNDIRHPEGIMRDLIQRLSPRGGRVFDPFAGLGTTLFVAESLHRAAYGVEADRMRYEWVAGQMTHWQRLHHGDAGRAARLGLPKMDLILTCPPFMRQTERWNPLAAGDPSRAGYDFYLRQLARIFAGLKPLLKASGRMAVLLENVPGRTFTPLVMDGGHAIRKSFRLEGESVVTWDGRPEGTVTHVLVFGHKR